MSPSLCMTLPPSINNTGPLLKQITKTNQNITDGREWTTKSMDNYQWSIPKPGTYSYNSSTGDWQVVTIDLIDYVYADSLCIHKCWSEKNKIIMHTQRNIKRSVMVIAINHNNLKIISKISVVTKSSYCIFLCCQNHDRNSSVGESVWCMRL